MHVMDCAELLCFIRSRIDYYLENKPEHSYGFCYWLDTTTGDIVNTIAAGRGVVRSAGRDHWCTYVDAYYVMSQLIQQYDSPELHYGSSFLSEEDGYNTQRADHLRNIRDTVLIPRIEGLL
jgi:hypothetical protein